MILSENKGYILLGIIALLSAWLVNLTTPIFFNSTPLMEHSPDYFGTAYIKWEMNEQGTLKNKLLADKILHYSDDGTTHTVSPLMFFYNNKMCKGNRITLLISGYTQLRLYRKAVSV